MTPDSSNEDAQPKREREIPTGIVRVDDFHVSRAISHYPTAAKEATMWLAAYMRERCAGQRDVVVAQLRKLGFQGVTENYIYRVLNGKYFTVNAEGKLVGSEKNLVQKIEALRAGVLLEERAGRTAFVETTTWTRIRDYIDLKRAPESVCKFGVIIGPTGGQKTECAKHYCHLNNHGLCVHLEAPARGTMSEFLLDLAARYTGRGSNRSHLNLLQMEVRRNVTDRKTIVIDNVQRLYRPGAGGEQPVFNYLQKLQDDTGCTVILMFAQLGADFLTKGLENGFFEQFEGRAGGRENGFLQLDDFMPHEDIAQIAAAYGVADAKSPAVVKYLEAISRKPGRCRILFNDLQQAKREADARGEKLCLDHIKFVRGEEGK